MPSMNVSLTPELVRIVQSHVESGLYGNASEVIRHAIRHMDANETLLYEVKLQRLKQALEPAFAALDRGDYEEYSLEDLNRDLESGGDLEATDEDNED